MKRPYSNIIEPNTGPWPRSGSAIRAIAGIARAAALAELAAEHCVGPAARAFEVGAGYGYNLSALKALYPDLLLFTDELDESIDLPDEIQRASLSDGPYDIVILSHVLEHFAYPKRVISATLNALSKNGVVVIEVPNDVPGIVPLNGPDEPHLTFFTAQTLNPSGVFGLCGECGTPMAKHCTNCNADLSATAKFCAECGTPANPPPA